MRKCSNAVLSGWAAHVIVHPTSGTKQPAAKVADGVPHRVCCAGSRLRSLQQLLQLESSAFWSMAGAGISVNVIATGVTLID
jgi:hypothetical protein